MPRRFSDVEDEQLIVTIRNYPELYDHGHKDFKNVQVKDGIWRTVASAVGRDVVRCKKRWKDIRDNYFKIERKNKSESSSAAKLRNRKWPLFEFLSFLQSVKQERRSHHRPDSEDGQSETSDVEILRVTCPRTELQQPPQAEALPEMQADSRPESPMSSIGSSAKRKHKPYCLRDLHRTAKCRGDKADRVPHKKNEEDDVDVFMRSVAMTIKKLPPPLIAQAKMSILSTVTQLQFPTSSIPFTASFAPLNIPALLTNIPSNSVNIGAGTTANPQQFSPSN